MPLVEEAERKIVPRIREHSPRDLIREILTVQLILVVAIVFITFGSVAPTTYLLSPWMLYLFTGLIIGVLILAITYLANRPEKAEMLDR